MSYLVFSRLLYFNSLGSLIYIHYRCSCLQNFCFLEERFPRQNSKIHFCHDSSQLSRQAFAKLTNMAAYGTDN